MKALHASFVEGDDATTEKINTINTEDDVGRAIR